MKILMVNKLYWPWRGGVEKTAQDIAEGINEKTSHQIRMLVCRQKGKGKIESLNNVKVFRAASFGMLLGMPLSIQFFFWFRKLAKESDILHIHHPFPLSVIAYLLFRPSSKLIVHHHSDILRQKISYALFKPFLKKFLRKSDLIIATNPRIVKNSPILKMFQKKCRIIPLGVKPENFALTEKIERKINSIQSKFSPPILLFVGRLVYYKGISYLIKAVSETKANLIIIGSGPLKSKLVKLAKKLNIINRVHFLDNISGKKLSAYYHACDVFILPSCSKTEAFGLVQIEAMACGKPVISTNLATGVPWVNQHQKTGLVVPPKDQKSLAKAINTLLDNKKLREKLGKDGKKRAEKFTVKKMNSKISRAYSSIFENS